ncbi:MmcQ/YjbR family DNA-binding protein [Pseudonocardia nigra]|uniref:MmcQ/YjbR family DNA-binding protein n=1 Tax=Pseudonocardia nigra TaxID=1921578 RepID=UPI001C5F8784|nr:MmcQ/YjbR family DNA-binding protein [Pseudonocardia nigra]
MSGPADVPSGILTRLRAICLALPQTHEEPAWVGTRWRIRTRTFAHVLTIDAGRPQAFARAAGTDGPCTVLTFRSTGPELDVLRRAGDPFFAPPWGADVVAMVLDADVDWDEVAELLTESYCARAPRALAELVDRPAES